MKTELIIAEIFCYDVHESIEVTGKKLFLDKTNLDDAFIYWFKDRFNGAINDQCPSEDIAKALLEKITTSDMFRNLDYELLHKTILETIQKREDEVKNAPDCF